MYLLSTLRVLCRFLANTDTARPLGLSYYSHFHIFSPCSANARNVGRLGLGEREAKSETFSPGERKWSWLFASRMKTPLGETVLNKAGSLHIVVRFGALVVYMSLTVAPVCWSSVYLCLLVAAHDATLNGMFNICKNVPLPLTTWAQTTGNHLKWNGCQGQTDKPIHTRHLSAWCNETCFSLNLSLK